MTPRRVGGLRLLWGRLTAAPRRAWAKLRVIVAGADAPKAVWDVLRVAWGVQRAYEVLRAAPPPVPPLVDGPAISVIVPVYNTDAASLHAMIGSVLAQTYPHWQLCLADDASTAPHIRPILEDYAAQDPRIVVHYRTENGHIAAASNSALALATAPFIALLDHDDELHPHALAEAARVLAADPDTDLIYTDEDKIDTAGRHSEPYLKPGWSPELLLNINVITHLAVLRRDLVEQVGGFRDGYVGSQDYDLFLRVTEHTNRVRHIPKVLYHWRTVPASTARSASAKDYATDATRRALAGALQRRGLDATLLPGRYLPFWRVAYTIQGAPTVAHLHADDPAQLAQALSATTAAYLLLTDSGFTPLCDDWQANLLQLAQLHGVGAVSPVVYGPARQIWHAGGWLHGGAWVRAWGGLTDVPYSVFTANLKDAVREVYAVTGECLLVKASALAAVGGIDPDLNTAWAPDLCLRLRAAGYRTLVTPFARVRTARRQVPTAADVAALRSRHAALFHNVALMDDPLLRRVVSPREAPPPPAHSQL